MMTPDARQFDDWIRGRFCDLNTELEELYFARDRSEGIAGVGQAQKVALCQEGQRLIASLAAESTTDQGFDESYALLGNVGFYMAACARHQIDESIAGTAARQREAMALAMELGASLGVVPRFLSSHMMTHNMAHHGRYKTFTTLRDEALFLDTNTMAVLAYKRAADALLRVVPLGVSHPVSAVLLRTAKEALEEVIATNCCLFESLDVERFFYHVRPYYKPHQVGSNVYRGTNAGDFAGINVLDLLLGLCRSSQTSYSQALGDKLLYMPPQEQSLLRDCVRRRSLMDEFLREVGAHAGEPWFRRNVALFLEVCEVHGRAASQHHNQLIEKFIKQPAAQMPTSRSQDALTASGPPLPVVLAALEKLRDQRCAAPRADVSTRHHEIQRLKALLQR
jgi:hypothetical protein